MKLYHSQDKVKHRDESLVEWIERRGFRKTPFPVVEEITEEVIKLHSGKNMGCWIKQVLLRCNAEGSEVRDLILTIANDQKGGGQ